MRPARQTPRLICQAAGVCYVARFLRSGAPLLESQSCILTISSSFMTLKSTSISILAHSIGNTVLSAAALSIGSAWPAAQLCVEASPLKTTPLRDFIFFLLTLSSFRRNLNLERPLNWSARRKDAAQEHRSRRKRFGIASVATRKADFQATQEETACLRLISSSGALLGTRTTS